MHEVANLLWLGFLSKNIDSCHLKLNILYIYPHICDVLQKCNPVQFYGAAHKLGLKKCFYHCCVWMYAFMVHNFYLRNSNLFLTTFIKEWKIYKFLLGRKCKESVEDEQKKGKWNKHAPIQRYSIIRLVSQDQYAMCLLGLVAMNNTDWWVKVRRPKRLSRFSC